MNKTRMIGIAAALASTCFATPALAATSTRVVITQDQQDVPETRIQLFDIDTGAEVKREEDEDETGALFLLDGGRDRGVVDGTTVREIAGSGAGREQSGRAQGGTPGNKAQRGGGRRVVIKKRIW